MAVVALGSAKGSPGVTVAGLALALTWQRPVVIAECDPAGGDIAPGYLRHLELDGLHGLMTLVVAQLRGHAGDVFWRQLIDLDPPHRRRLLLPGITRHAQAASLEPNWPRLADFFAGLENIGLDVIVDCGRLVAPHPPWPVLRRADLVLLVVRPTLSSLVAATALLESLTDRAGVGVGDRVQLVAVGDGDYDDRAVSRTVGAPVMAHLPHDRRSAQVLSHGGTVHPRRPLFRAAVATQRLAIAAVEQHRLRLRGPHRGEATRVDV